MSIVSSWGLTLEELDEILAYRPSVRGMLSGFVAEYRLTKMWFTDPRVHGWKRFGDHDRERPGDFGFTYRGTQIAVEVKSLQSNSIRHLGETIMGKFQCDASDSGTKTLPNGEKLKTTCLVRGGFDLLAVNLFEFEHKWNFAFLRNADYPSTTHAKYTVEQRKHLLATTATVTWPLQRPFHNEPYALLDQIVSDKQSSHRRRK